MRHKKNARLLRPLSAQEREIRMFLGRCATAFACSANSAKANPQDYGDIRCSSIGNTFHAGVVALLVAPMLRGKGLLKQIPTPQELIWRMGLRPGELFVEGRDCSPQRPAEPHRLDGRRRGMVHPSVEAARLCVDRRSSLEVERHCLHALLQSSDYQGSDVRFDTGEIYHPAAWPRRSLELARWA